MTHLATNARLLSVCISIWSLMFLFTGCSALKSKEAPPQRPGSPSAPPSSKGDPSLAPQRPGSPSAPSPSISDPSVASQRPGSPSAPPQSRGDKSVGSQSPGTPSAPPQSQGVYLDFGDVLIPKQLKLNHNNSFIFSTSGFKAGVLSLRGRVDVSSLMSYFENKMPVDGWQLVSVIKASRSMLLFQKQERWCVISIIEGRLSSRVEIWVAPTLSGQAGGLVKP